MQKVQTRVAGWLQGVPVTDPVDRRNAVFVQVLLFFFVVFVLINKLLYLGLLFDGQWQATRSWTVDAGTGALMCGMAGVALWMIRCGHFRWAVSLFIAAIMLAMSVVYVVIDVGHMSMQVYPLLVVALGGLVLGRGALRVIVGVQVSIYFLCLLSNLAGFAPGSVPPLVSVGIFIATAGSYLLMAYIVDRAATTLRGSLAEAQRKTRELEWEMAEREKARAQLVHAQKMEVVGRAASGVAHDFDTVLSVIIGYAMRAERLADEGVEALLAAVRGMREAAERASRISRKLLDFGRNDMERPECIELGGMLADTQPMLRQLFGSRVHVRMQLPDTPLQVRIDRSRFELTLLSMASNARDAMPHGGCFTIRAALDATDSVVVEVQDDGVGIAAWDLDNIFEPFYTTKPGDRGTGLGLSVARDVILRAGGDITVHSEPHQGTTFCVRLPRVSMDETRDDAVARDPVAGFSRHGATSSGPAHDMLGSPT